MDDLERPRSPAVGIGVLMPVTLREPAVVPRSWLRDVADLLITVACATDCTCDDCPRCHARDLIDRAPQPLLELVAETHQ